MERANAYQRNIREIVDIASANYAGNKIVAGRGFRTLINNRPNDDDPTRLSANTERREAMDQGLSYAFIPVTADTITEADVRAFQRAVAESDGPVLAHCKDGTHSLNLYLIGEVLDGRMSDGEVAVFGRNRGFDTSSAVGWLKQQATHRPQVQGFLTNEPQASSTW